MNEQKIFEYAKSAYAAYGVDVEAAIAKVAAVPVAMHCCRATMSVALTPTPTSR